MLRIVLKHDHKYRLNVKDRYVNNRFMLSTYLKLYFTDHKAIKKCLNTDLKLYLTDLKLPFFKSVLNLICRLRLKSVFMVIHRMP